VRLPGARQGSRFRGFASVTTVPFGVGTPGGKGTVRLTPDPGRTGGNAVQAVVFAPDGGPTAVPELRLFVTPPLPSTWTARVTVRTSEADRASGTARVRITP
jgi:copper transport protein